MKMPSIKIKLSAINLLNLMGAVIIVYLAVILGQTVMRNYQMSQQAEELKHQIALLQDQKEALKYSTEYYKTEAYREREARAKLGLQLPGEQVVILPRVTSTPAPIAETDKIEPKKRSNFQQWLDFLAGRG